jgi:hypothetical protein
VFFDKNQNKKQLDKDEIKNNNQKNKTLVIDNNVNEHNIPSDKLQNTESTNHLKHKLTDNFNYDDCDSYEFEKEEKSYHPLRANENNLNTPVSNVNSVSDEVSENDSYATVIIRD